MEKIFNDFVDISVRIKPQPEQETTNSCIEVLSRNPAVLLVHSTALDKSQTYHFDNIFDDEFDQERIYNDTVRPLLDKVKAGYNCTVLTYGQTGTGKTYTMGTNSDVINEEECGLIPRTLEDFFSWENANTEVQISISFIEIYNEKVFDLLSNQRKLPLSIKGFKVQGFNKEIVYSSYDAKQILKMGNRNRHIAETKQNASSSRSHAIFTIYCNIRNYETETVAKLNLVDLAGSESVRKTGNQGSTFQEGVNINKGLLCVGQVMTALSSNLPHIPYRQSIITTILQDSLNKRNYVSLIACVSASLDDSCETMRTLEFANRVKKMKNKPEVNQIITQYKKDNPSVFLNQYKLGTPLKRGSNSILYTTPFKRCKNVMPMASLPEQQNSTTLDSPKSLFELSISSVSSDAMKQNYSPVIKKCMSVMENTFLNNLEDIITKTLNKKTKRRSEKEKTPSLPWSNIKNEVSRLVREEVAQFTVKASRAASSPVENEDKNSLPRRVLNYDNNNENCSPNIENVDEEIFFKVPAVPIKRVVSTKPKSPVKPRRSLRLQLNTTINSENNRPRRSGRISAVTKDNELVKDNEVSRQRKSKKNLNLSPQDISKVNLKNSPITTHTKQVLHILNKGSVKELQKLHSVGIKTAESILLFRQLKGQLKKMSDLAEMPGWPGNRYKKFLDQNFLRNI